MSSQARAEYLRQYSKKYYQHYKKEINEKKKISSARRQKLMSLIYKYWKAGKIIPVSDIVQEKLEGEIKEITDKFIEKKPIKIIFLDE